jgi:hypothetical protein
MPLQPVVFCVGGVHGLGVQRFMRSQFWRSTVYAAVITIAFAAAAMAADDKKAEKKHEKKPPSACVGLDINACGAKAECKWSKQLTTKAGKVRKAHCRLKTHQQLAKKTT